MLLGRVPGGSRNADARLWQVVERSSNTTRSSKSRVEGQRRSSEEEDRWSFWMPTSRGPASDPLILPVHQASDAYLAVTCMAC